jgi:hypothetical protein
MRSLASNAQSWKELLVEFPPTFDDHLYFYENQGSPWALSPFVPSSSESRFNEFDEFINQHIERPYKDPNIVVIPPGHFSIVHPYLALDEWTYLTGVKCTPHSDASLIAQWGTLKRRLDEQHFRFIEVYRGFTIVWIDGWWECFFADDALFDRTKFGGRHGRTEPMKWISGNWCHPEFNAEGAAPNGGPATPTASSGVAEGPPSVS